MTSIEYVDIKSQNQTFKNACRTCATFFNEDVTLKPIFFNSNFNQNKGSQDDPDKFRPQEELAILKFEIEENDDLPQNICKECYEKLNEIYTFRIKCKKSEEFFKNSLKTNILTENILSLLDENDSLNTDIEISFKSISKSPSEDFNLKERNISPCSDLNSLQKCDTNYNTTTENIFKDEVEIKIEPADNDQNELNNEIPASLTKCQNCWRFCYLTNLKIHQKFCVKKKKKPCFNRCIYCLKKYKCIEFAVQHILTDHENLPFFCDYCKKSFEIEKECSDHIMTHFQYKCNADGCNEKFAFKVHLAKHRRKYHNYLKCPFCEKQFIFESELIQHKNTIHQDEIDLFNPEINKCEQCNEVFTSVYLYNKHKQAYHSGKDEYECKICNKKMKNWLIFRYHVKSHNPNKRHKCSYCEKSFMQTHHLKQHERVHTGEKVYKCEECNKAWKDYLGYKLHLERYHAECRFICDLCGEGFIFEARLKRHTIKYHTGDFPFSCSLCNKKFFTEGEINRHTRIEHHDGKTKKKINKKQNNRSITKSENITNKITEKIFLCPICPKSFKSPSAFDYHLKRHRNDTNKYVCKICNCTYKRPAHLRRHHKMVHDSSSAEYCAKRKSSIKQGVQDYKFKCDLCRKKLKTEKGFQAHMEQHKKQDPIECVLCGEEFKTLNSLRLHDYKHLKEVKSGKAFEVIIAEHENTPNAHISEVMKA